MSRGPKPQSPAEKLSTKLSPSIDLNEAFADYPNHIETCFIWTGNPQQVISVGKSSKRAIRAMFEVACEEELHPFWRPSNNCGDPRCLNPTHHSLRAYNAYRYGDNILLPRKLRPTMTAEEIEAELAAMDPVAEVLDFIDAYFPRPTIEEFKRLMAEKGVHFDDALVEQAYATFTDQRS